MSRCPAAAPDPEAPWPPAPPARACRPLPWALGAALLLLAATCAACVARTWAAPGPALGPSRSPRTRHGPEPAPDARAGLRDSPRQGQFAQLVARSVLLANGTLSWHSDPVLAGVSLSPGLSYDEDTREVVVAEAGVYYIFLHLELRRVVARQGSGSVSLSVHLRPERSGAAALAFTVDLPPGSLEKAPDSAAGFRSRLLHLGAGQRLSVHLHAEAEARPAWQLAQGATLLGLFRVATEAPDGPSSP
ncbi:LOW QUALITY PROTEIN: tumor necrosis factor ligand superfamily member 9 [Lepus europaeus]|uniref:LOW QUALITY PROTEIN: tumor necrosis factor ligand superfamily member 9 n=1 Tax=Lepus europaeus TaxID=9983 RepID=UPI002B473636|nr:LOW QUALITY PROTEIN: tumor necrosis factor ligand superfamily member 9 [Lepus europaeus]